MTIVQNASAYEGLLKTKPRDEKFAEFFSELDLNSPQFAIDIKTGTTSVGLRILKDQKYVAYWYPKGNLSLEIEGQVVTYYLGRFLEINEIVAPSEYFSISGAHLEQFIGLLEKAKTENTDPSLQPGIENVLAEAKSHLEQALLLPGAVILKIENFEVQDLVFWEKNEFNRDHAIARMIRADQPQPSATTVLDLPQFVPEDGEVNTSTELQLAKELSQMMVLDMLSGQRDRFSGGNVEARFDKSKDDPKIGKLRFISRDNSASAYFYTDIDDPEFLKYMNIVTRFDKDQIERVELLVQLIKADPVAMQRTLRMVSDTDYLLRRAEAVLQHVQKQIDLYGKENAFFQKK